ncbi:MAG TPA: DUF5132 domain-containing protein [Oculatellaceae cyanobacterium]
MFEDLLEVVAGPWSLVALAVVALPAGRKALRTVAREAVRAGIAVSESAKDLYAELKEEASDVVAEVKAERKHSVSKTAHKAHE